MLWRDWEKLWRYLEMSSLDDLEGFVRGDLFKPFFEELYTTVIKPAQEGAGRTAGTQRPRGLGLRAIQQALIQGEKGGLCRYSSHRPNKREWKPVDHYAYFLFCVRDENARSHEGIFFGRGLSEAQMDDRVWQLLRRVAYDHSPSRVAKSKGAFLITGSSTSEVTPAPKGQSLSPPTDESSSLPTANTLPLPMRDAPQPLNPVKAAHSLPVKPAPAESDLKRYGLSNPTLGKPSLRKTAIPTASRAMKPSPGHSRRISSAYTSSDDEERRTKSPSSRLAAAAAKGVAFEDQTSSTNDIDDEHDEDIGVGTGKNPLDNAERMLAERTSDKFDLSDRWWQRVLILEVVKNEGDWDAIHQVLAHVYDDDRMNNAMSVAWEQEVAAASADQLIPFAPFTAESAVLFDKQQKWFDNIVYQRENMEEACKNLGIENPDVARIPGMPRCCRLQFWQPVAIEAIRRFREPGYIRGCVLADVVGLGKTWVVIGYLLARYNEWMKCPVQERPVRRTTMIIVPPNLIDQWIAEIERVAPVFKVYKYHGDKRAKSVGKEIIVDKELNKGHPLMIESNDNALAVIITSYGTMTSRHGVGTQRSWRRRHGWTSRAVAEQLSEYDTAWPAGLQGCIDTIVLDEAHLIKNEETDVNTAISWLSADFHVFLTATPLLNGVKDFNGFLRMIEPEHSEYYWKPENLRRFQLSPDVNPYTIPPDNEATILQVTQRAGKAFIFSQNSDPVLQGKYISKIWAQCLIRRTYASSIPFNSDHTIGKNLPRIQNTVLECQFRQDEQDRYDLHRQRLEGKLVYTDEKTQKPRWSFGILRKLTLACIWQDFELIEGQVKASSISFWVNKKNFIWRWLKILSKKKPDFVLPDENDERGQLACLVKGSPKLRTLLKLLADQVVRDQEKVMVWCIYPSVQLFIYGALRLLNIDARLYTADVKPKDRDDILSEFTGKPKQAMVLIMSYMVGSCGLNLQQLCWNVHLFDPPPNDPIGVQAVGRARRLGNPSPVVYVWEYYLRNSFNDRVVQLNLKKALPGVMADLNQQLFRGKAESDDSEDVDLGQWVEIDGKLVSADSYEAAGSQAKILDPEELLNHIMFAMKGQHVLV